MGKKQQPQSCLNCKFADYRKTPTGKLVKGTTVYCRWKSPTKVEFVAMLRGLLPESVLTSWALHCPGPSGMHPDTATFGAKCSQWQPIEEATDAPNPT
jgi:hypothetical protein